MKIKHTGAPYTSVYHSTKHKGTIEFVTASRPLTQVELTKHGKAHESKLAARKKKNVIEVDLRHLI